MPGEKEFLDFLGQKKNLPKVNEEVSLMAVGDISYSRGVERIIKKKNNIHYPFLKIQDYLKNADLAFGNLETPITEGREIADAEMVFRSNPGTELALKQAGFSILSLANNHTPNFGQKGLEDTFKFLDDVGIKYIGAWRNEQQAYQAVYLKIKGIKFAFLAYNDMDVVPTEYEANSNRAGTAFMRTEIMTEAVKEAKQKADITIVSMHSGTEYRDKPNDSQIAFAHAAIDSGADLVVGHHPHVVQIMEKYRGKYIFYSLGNFVFDQPWSSETKEGLLIKAYFTKDGVNRISLVPIVMDNFAQPEPADGNRAEKILKRLTFSLTNRPVYFWNNDDFERDSRAVVYGKNYQTGSLFSQSETADLDDNSFPELYFLENGRLTISENSKVVWQSPDDWWIDSLAIADSDNDGITDINLSLWKAGSFGSSKPFWIEENDMSVENHFFIYDFIEGTMKSVWGSSNLTAPNCEFKIIDVDGDNKNDLVVIEGNYEQMPECRGEYVAVWKWNGWGFSNEWRNEKGNFSDLEIEKINGKTYILVDSL